MTLRARALAWTLAVMASRPPDFEIGPPEDRYLRRWIVFPWGRYERGSKPKNWFAALKRKLPNIYLHQILHDDEDRALHNHPFSSISWLLQNAYWEVLHYPLSDERIAELQAKREMRPTVKVYRPEGKVVFRKAAEAHRLVLEKRPGSLGRVESVPVVSMFFTGFIVQEWGFICGKGFVPWREFVSARDRGQVGAGCGD